MHVVLSNLKPQRRAFLAAALIVLVGAAIALPKLNAHAAAGLNTISINPSSSGAEGTAADGSVTFTVSVSGLLLGSAGVHYQTHDGTATTADNDYVEAHGDIAFSTGTTSATVVVKTLKDTKPEPNETFTVVLTNVSNATAGNATGTGTINNDDVEFNIGDVTIGEGGGVAHVPVTVTAGATSPVSVHVATQNGSAVAPGDFTAVPDTVLSFPVGTTTKNVDVTINQDTADEDNENFFVVLSAPSGGTLGSNASGKVTITDDDTAASLPAVSMAPAAFPEGNTGTTDAVFILTLSAPSARTVTVHAKTSDDTATAPADYAAAEGNVTFAPGTTTGEFHVLIKGDAVFEGNETFKITLSAPDGATIGGTNPAIGTITEDDAKPTVNVANATATEGGDATFNVALSAASAVVTKVHVVTADDTAKAPGDYTALPDTTVTFDAGETGPKAVIVHTVQDTVDEADETFKLHVASVENSAATVGTDGTGTITDDDNSPSLSVANVSADEGNSGDKTFTFTATLSAASGRVVTAHYQTADNTATIADGDYAATSGDLSFAIGETTKTFNVIVKGDTKAENDETFKVNFTNAVGASLATASATGTIKNEDGTPPPPAQLITTGPGAGGGPHVRTFNSDGSGGPGFLAAAPSGPGLRVARGDLDGDGHDEIVIASGPGAQSVVRVLNATGGIIASIDAYPGFQGGVYVAVGDVDGDGHNEVITSAGAGGGPHVRTFALTGDVGNRSLVGSTGFFAAAADFSDGLTVAAGNVDSSPKDEIIVGHGAGGQAIVSVWNYTPNGAATKNAEFLAYAGFNGGVNVAAGDLDGDGTDEIVTGAGAGGGPHVRVLSGVGGGYADIFAYSAAFHGGVNVAVGDIDGDGDNEIITGTGPGGGPHVRAFQDVVVGSHVEIQPTTTSFYAYDPNFSGGVFVAAGRT